VIVLKIGQFQELVWDYYRDHAREMPWREDPNPYWVVVSEVMLQQTQVSRVLEKFPQFIKQFDSFEKLAAARPADVIAAWQGLGYNRRALNLQKLAQAIDEELPRDPAELVKLPGIGPGTAGSIAAFAFDAPAVFIETNIRRVFIHHFFEDQEGVDDKQLLPLVEQALDREQPREWYYALMDYGTHLAKTVPNPNRRSKHHAVQSKFEGSDRQIRGEILRHLIKATKGFDELFEQSLCSDKTRFMKILDGLRKDGLVERTKKGYQLPK
jgi:A/G-specific adenine glycosylase